MLEFIYDERLELKQIYEQEIQNNFELELRKIYFERVYYCGREIDILWRFILEFF